MFRILQSQWKYGTQYIYMRKATEKYSCLSDLDSVESGPVQVLRGGRGAQQRGLGPKTIRTFLISRFEARTGDLEAGKLTTIPPHLL